MDKKLVIVDVDDVLIDLNDSVADLLSIEYKNFNVENIVTFDLNKNIDIKKLTPSHRGYIDNGLGCPRERILSMYTNLYAFENAKITDNAYEGIKLLSEYFDVVVHTNNFSLEIAEFKIKLLRSLFENINISYSICIGKEKPAFENVFAVFEDCIGNIVKYSDSCRKILIDRPHNREVFNGKSLSEAKNLVRVENFYTGVELLLKEASDCEIQSKMQVTQY